MKRAFWVSVVTALVVMSCSFPMLSDTAPQSEASEPPSEPSMPPPTPLPPTELPAPTETAVPPTETIPPPTATPAPLTLSSSAFEAEAWIPVRHSCHGPNLSPPLAWTQPPAETQSLVLIMDDPDAVVVAGYVWDHWLLFNIPGDTLGLEEGLQRDIYELPDGSQQGLNSFNAVGWGGPCPPGGQTHSYVFTLYALDTSLELHASVRKPELITAMEGHILDQADLIGKYTSP